jgi:hypothetical protein
LTGELITDQLFPPFVVLIITPLLPTEYPIEEVGKEISANPFDEPVSTICQDTPPSDDSSIEPSHTATNPWIVSVNVIASSQKVVGTEIGYHCACKINGKQKILMKQKDRKTFFHPGLNIKEGFYLRLRLTKIHISSMSST